MADNTPNLGFGEPEAPTGDVQAYKGERTARTYKLQSYLAAAGLAFIVLAAAGIFVKSKVQGLLPSASEKKPVVSNENTPRRKFDDKPLTGPGAKEEYLDLPSAMTTPASAAPTTPSSPTTQAIPLVPAPTSTGTSVGTNNTPVFGSPGAGTPIKPKGSLWIDAQDGPADTSTVAVANPKQPATAPGQALSATPVFRPQNPAELVATKGTELAQSLEGTKTKPTRATKVTGRNLALLAGSFVPCVMQTELVSSVAGFVSCVVTDNVYSDDGTTLLIDKGAQVIGEFRTAVRTGDARLFVLWNRIKTKNGVLVDIGSPGGDQVGGMGLPGTVDNHWWERIGAAFLLSTFQDFMAIEKARASGSNGGTVVNSGGANTTEASQSLAKQVLSTTINIPPTIYKHRGDEIVIYVARDMQFDDVYKIVAAK